MNDTVIIIIAACVIILMIVALVILSSHNKTKKALRTRIGMPVPDGALNSFPSWRRARSLVEACDQKDVALSTAQDIESRRRISIGFADKKLSFFHDISLPAVSPSYAQNIRTGELRHDEDEADILAGNVTPRETAVAEYLQLLNDNKMSGILAELDSAKTMDTSGVFRKVSLRKLTDQTDTYRRLYQAAVYEYRELQDLAGKMNILLDYLRSCAYRNLYLGSELLNIVRDNSGGGGLQKLDESISVSTIGLDSAVLKELTVSYDVGVVLSSFGRRVESLSKSKSYKQLAIRSPKAAIGVQALALAGSIIEHYEDKRNQKIDSQLKMQKQLMKLFPRIVSGYNEAQPVIVRSLELARAIVEVNKGFIKLYAPLRDKVYSESGVVCRQEIVELAAAMKAYNKISKSTL